ncbi:terminase small subunit [Metabacillus fastidiosus]|uniref:terminase small subunit n=1 Tax=Metabacillus fastidiosus TaxID=1458 RepID=UPI002E1BBB73|nr:terminase small subunit [Metabacillus fastidiosus]
MRITEKQRKFAEYYLETGNAEESARRAGYSENTARGHAHKLLQNVAILQYIDKNVAKKDRERFAGQEEVLEYLTSIMRGEQKEEVLRGIGQGAQVIDKLEVSAKDRIKAAEMLGKRYGLWIDRQQIEGEALIKFEYNFGDEDGKDD